MNFILAEDSGLPLAAELQEDYHTEKRDFEFALYNLDALRAEQRIAEKNVEDAYKKWKNIEQVAKKLQIPSNIEERQQYEEAQKELSDAVGELKLASHQYKAARQAYKNQLFEVRSIKRRLATLQKQMSQLEQD